MSHTEDTDAVVVTDCDRGVLFWTPAAERIYGWSEPEVVGRRVSDLVRFDLSAEERAEVRRATADAGSWHGEVAAFHRGGSRVDIAVTVAALRDATGDLLGFLHIHRDVTERNRSAQAMLDARRRTEAVLDSITDAVFGVDREWRYTYINQPALERLRRRVAPHLTEDDVVGTSMWRLMAETGSAEFGRRMREAMREQRAVECVNYVQPTGEFIEVRIFPSDEGLSVCYRDVTERRREELQLTYHAQLLESMEDAVIAMDERFVVTAWNRAAESMFGWTADEAVGRLLYELNASSFSDAEVKQQFGELMENGRWRGEGIWYGKHGKPLIGEGLSVALRPAEGAVTGYLAIVRDVTERWQSRRELSSRASQHALVAELSLRARGSHDLQALLDDAASLLAGMLDVELATVSETLPDGHALRWRAIFGWSAKAVAEMSDSPASPGSLVGYTLAADGPVVSDDVTADERFTISPAFAEQGPVSAILVVIPSQGGPFGVLAAAAREHRSFTSDDVGLMQTVANILGIAVERSRMEDRLESERENERRRIARDLHDEALSELSDALAAATVARSTSSSGTRQQQWAGQTAALRRISQRVRSSIYDLRLDNDNRGFADLLVDLIALQDDISAGCQIQLGGPEQLPTESLGRRGTEVLRIVREAITNARRHSGATTVRVDAHRFEHNLLRLEIIDDGTAPEQVAAGGTHPGSGITGMLERADLLSAELQIENRVAGGTTVRLDFALDVLRGAQPASG